MGGGAAPPTLAAVPVNYPRPRPHHHHHRHHHCVGVSVDDVGESGDESGGECGAG